MLSTNEKGDVAIKQGSVKDRGLHCNLGALKKGHIPSPGKDQAEGQHSQCGWHSDRGHLDREQLLLSLWRHGP